MRPACPRPGCGGRSGSRGSRAWRPRCSAPSARAQEQPRSTPNSFSREGVSADRLDAQADLQTKELVGDRWFMAISKLSPRFFLRSSRAHSRPSTSFSRLSSSIIGEAMSANSRNCLLLIRKNYFKIKCRPQPNHFSYYLLRIRKSRKVKR